LLQMISITLMASCIDSGELGAYFFIGLKVVVYLPSKYIVGDDVTTSIFLSWMIILRHESVSTFGPPWDSSYCAIILSSYFQYRAMCGSVCMFVYAYQCV
jgi:hypothetical protein